MATGNTRGTCCWDGDSCGYSAGSSGDGHGNDENEDGGDWECSLDDDDSSSGSMKADDVGSAGGSEDNDGWV